MDSSRLRRGSTTGRAAALRDEVSCAYYFTLQLVLVDVMTGCKAAHSGWMSPGYSNRKDVGRGAGRPELRAGQHTCPYARCGCAHVRAAVHPTGLPTVRARHRPTEAVHLNDLPNMHAVNAMAGFCLHHGDWQHFVSELALLLVAVRHARIVEAHHRWRRAQERGVLSKVTAAVKAAKRWAMADDVDKRTARRSGWRTTTRGVSAGASCTAVCRPPRCPPTWPLLTTRACCTMRCRRPWRR